jgi:N-acetylglucosaminyl-diphospho-decaprenol L-rhamnosyltransferase
VVVVANADVRFAPGAPAALAAAVVEAGDVGVAGPRVVYPDGRHQASARTLPDPVTAIVHALLRWVLPGNRWTARYRQTGHDPAVARDVGWVSGCALAVRRTAFDAVDGFDPGYPLYLEDVDLAARLAEAGWRVRYDPRTTVVHRVGASTGRRRWRALVWHARGLDRYVGRRYGAAGRALRPLLRVALAGWVVATYLAERRLGRGRSTTGE